MSETIEQLIASVRELREEYERAMFVNRQLIAQRHELAEQMHQWAKRVSEVSPFHVYHGQRAR